MITLHHCMSARSFRPLWALEELGLPYELRMLPFPPRAHARSYLELNPLGTVPLLVDAGVRLTESVAICQYLAARHSPGGLDVGLDEPDFGAYLNHLHYGEATLTFPQSLVLRYTHFEPPERRVPQVAQDYEKWFLARLKPLEPLLTTQDHLCAGRFTAADISVGYALMLAEHLGLGDRLPPAVRAYGQRLQARPGHQRALAAQVAAATAQGVSTLPAPDLRP
jgi:glutathione S-transferase